LPHLKRDEAVERGLPRLVHPRAASPNALYDFKFARLPAFETHRAARLWKIMGAARDFSILSAAFEYRGD
jgi:hypothetical protein